MWFMCLLLETNLLGLIGKGDFTGFLYMKTWLKFLKGKLRTWNYEVFRKINLRVEEDFKDLNEMDQLVARELRLVSDDVPPRSLEASKKVWHMRFELKFFHEIWKMRFTRNVILWLNTNGGRLEQVKEFKLEIQNYFQNKFQEFVGRSKI